MTLVVIGLKERRYRASAEPPTSPWPRLHQGHIAGTKGEGEQGCSFVQRRFPVAAPFFSTALPPVDGASGAVFLVMPSRAKDRAIISETYPAAKSHGIPCVSVDQSVWNYEVAAEEIGRLASR